MAEEKAISQIYLGRLNDMREMVKAYLSGELDGLDPLDRALRYLVRNYCAYFGIPLDMLEKKWAAAGIVSLVEGSFDELQRLILEQIPVPADFVANLGGLEGATHTYLSVRALDS